ncbi:MAG: YHS domain-containing (seleno)protein [Pseudomonadota bacterium]
MLKRILVVLSLLVTAASAYGKDEINSSLFGNLAIKGTDPVAYFDNEGPVKGRKDFEYEWKGANWRFSSAENRDLFIANPERYAPQYGGYCAYAVSQGYTAGIDPDAWSIVDGKLYLNYSLDIREDWEKMRNAYIEAANKNWPDVLK